MSKSTGYVNNEDEIAAYLSTMVDHAEKHGIKILGLVADMPMLDKSVASLTRHGKKKPTLTMSLVNDLQISTLMYDMEKNKNVRKLDEWGEPDDD